MFELDPGAHVEVRRGSEPVLLARLRGARGGAEGAEIGAPFTDRLVAKFGLPIAGWRGRGDRLRVPHGGVAAEDTMTAAQASTTAGQASTTVRPDATTAGQEPAPAGQRDEEPGGDA